VEENVKKGVKELRKHSSLSKAYSSAAKSDRHIDVFVHGMVFDEVTGEVHDLHISFGPPGKKIPHIPFKAVAAAKNIHRDKDRPGISRGKT
jgi:carbonic anhydrase